MNNNLDLDSLMIKEGEEINENDIKTVNKQDVEKQINNPFAYDSNTPIPGEDIDDKISEQINNIDKNTALDSLITKAAIIKAKNESTNENKKLSKEELEKVKKNFCEQLFYQQQEDYYTKYHSMMDGKTKRRVRKTIERNFDKGRYNKFLYNTGKSLND